MMKAKLEVRCIDASRDVVGRLRASFVVSRDGALKHFAKCGMEFVHTRNRLSAFGYSHHS